MNNRTFFLSFLAVITFFSCQPDSGKTERTLELWYSQPATRWVEALPVGNGRLGAMVFGGVEQERIQLNEESLWSGGPIPRANPEALQHLGKVRQLLFEKKYEEAEKMAQEKIMGLHLDGGMHTYQTLGDLFIRMDGMEGTGNYRRSLDLNRAVATTSFTKAGVTYTREVFSSFPDQVLAIRISASEKNKISLETWLNRPGDAEAVEVNDNRLEMYGFAECQGMGTYFSGMVQMLTKGGTRVAADTSLIVKDADEVLLLVAGRTDYWGDDPVLKAGDDLSRAASLGFNKLKQAHEQDYRSLFKRVELAIGSPDTLNLPTDQRLEQVKAGGADTHLAELYFQFGRYLLISSSRPGGLPANLQGIWDGTLAPPWNADYHININIQMNYWPAEITNLSELHQPFFDFVEKLIPSGQQTARETYGCRGFTAHHTTDAWKFTDVIGRTGWGLWPLGAAWCSDHFWEHFEYTGDTVFLEKRAYPVLKEAALFFVDYLTPNPETGLLVSGPSISPENGFITKTGKRGTVCMGPAMDHQIIRELFNNCIRTSEITGQDQAFSDTLRTLLTQLTPSQIGSDGRILEWSEELPEWEPGHRHISHLYALHPGEEFTNPADPKWMEASRKVIDYRLSHGGGHTGWSRAWIINFFARLKDGAKVEENFQALLAKSTLPNLFDNHPPFQIDGNFGATAGIAEALLQSHNQVLQLLPALPPGWPSGKITGLRARGGFEVGLYWENGRLVKTKVRSLLGKPLKIHYNGTVREFELPADREIILNGELQQI